MYKIGKQLQSRCMVIFLNLLWCNLSQLSNTKARCCDILLWGFGHITIVLAYSCNKKCRGRLKPYPPWLFGTGSSAVLKNSVIINMQINSSGKWLFLAIQTCFRNSIYGFGPKLYHWYPHQNYKVNLTFSMVTFFPMVSRKAAAVSLRYEKRLYGQRYFQEGCAVRIV